MNNLIREAVECLSGAAPAGSRVILFGSHARGDARDDSDIDLLVIEPEVHDRSSETIRWPGGRREKAARMNSPAEYAAALLRRAVGDQYVVERLAGDAQAPAWVLGFHAQQAVEKALKAVLCFHGIQFPRTHNLAMLLELLRRASHSTPPDGTISIG